MIAREILNQLGGNKFIAMTGARDFGSTGNSLVFKIGRNGKGVTHVRVTLTPMDWYDMEFIRVHGFKRSIVATAKGVYNDVLQYMFTYQTGLNTSL